MFYRSKIVDNLRDFCIELDQGDILKQKSCNLLKKIGSRLREIRACDEAKLDSILLINVSTLFNDRMIDFLDKLITTCNTMDLSTLISILVDIGIDVQEVSYEIASKYENTIELLRLHKEDHAISYLNSAFNAFNEHRNRDCIVQSACVIENLLKKRLGQLDDKKALGQLLRDKNLYNVINKDFEKDIDEIRKLRNTNGAHGTLEYTELDNDEIKYWFKILLNIINDGFMWKVEEQ